MNIKIEIKETLKIYRGPVKVGLGVQGFCIIRYKGGVPLGSKRRVGGSTQLSSYPFNH